jgi:hypothetical protein
LNSSIFSTEAAGLLQEHFEHLHTGSGISVGVIRERGYRSILGKAELEKLGFSPSQQRIPGILVPLWGVDGEVVGYQYRPDHPRSDQRNRPIKYESVPGSSNHLDCPPRCRSMLPDPAIPLWVTEGSKKADALASRGACAISLTGVWGFKGKNDLGGITLLAEWDLIALKGRNVYLAFDSDIVTKKPVRKALHRLEQHLERKGAVVLVVRLPQEGPHKVGIDDYLLNHSLEEVEGLAEELEGDEEGAERSTLGFILPDGTVGEMVVDGDGQRAFIIARTGSVRKVERYETGAVTYVPSNDPLVGQVVHFAATAAPYDSQLALFREVKAFIHRYLELPGDFEDISALYVLLTWVYEFAPSIPYLRVIGDWGSGKTRFLEVVGSICFRPMFASGATTPSPIFRILDRFRGTLVLDEADFKDSSAWVEMVKILNNGYRPGYPVLRAEKEDGKWHPRSYQVFGPKLIATRYHFKDEALESRCLTAEMMPLSRQDIPRVLPPSFQAEVNELRSRLLTFRLANLLKLKGRTFGNELLEPNLQPRLQEILIPLKAMVNGDQAMAESLTVFIHQLQEALFSERRQSPAGRVLAAIIELHDEGTELSIRNITDKANEADSDAPALTSEKVGWMTKKLGFEKERTTKSRFIRWDEVRVKQLSSLYGLAQAPISQEKPSKPSSLSLSDRKRDDGLEDVGKPSQEPSQAGSISGNDGHDSNDRFLRDKRSDDAVCSALGMTAEQAIAIWAREGRPVIHLGPGENCFDLERLLSHRDINGRHLEAVRQWLARKERPPDNRA